MDGEQPTFTMDCSLGIHHPERRQTKTPTLDESIHQGALFNFSKKMDLIYFVFS